MFDRVFDVWRYSLFMTHRDLTDQANVCYCESQVFFYNQFHNILDFSMFYQIFLSSQVKRWAIITYKHGM